MYRSNDGVAARLGLAVSKKNCRRAVGRNRLKRIIRESFRRHKEMLEGLDIVVLNQAATHRADNKKLFDSLHRHWSRCANEAAEMSPRDKV